MLLPHEHHGQAPEPGGKKRDRELAYSAIAVGIVGALFGWLTLRKKAASTSSGGYTYPMLNPTGTTAGGAGGGGTTGDTSTVDAITQGFAQLADQQSAGLSFLSGQIATIPTGATQSPADSGITSDSVSAAIAGVNAQIAGLAAQVAAIPAFSAPQGTTLPEVAGGATGSQVGATPTPEAAPAPMPFVQPPITSPPISTAPDGSTVATGVVAGGYPVTYGGNPTQAQTVFDTNDLAALQAYYGGLFGANDPSVNPAVSAAPVQILSPGQTFNPANGSGMGQRFVVPGGYTVVGG